MIPFNKFLLRLALLVLPFSLFAQVKTLVTRDNSQTTTVIKEDQSSDEVILSQLDIDEFGMHEVIRIVYENKASEVSATSKPTNIISSVRQEEAIVVNFSNENSSTELTSTSTDQQLFEPSLIQQKRISSSHAAQIKAQQLAAPIKKLNPNHSGDYPVFTEKKRLQNPRVKKKRKKRKQNKKGCPKF